MKTHYLLLVGWYCCIGASPIQAAELSSAPADEQALRTAGIATEGPSLVKFFRQRTPDEVGRKQLATLIQQLGDPAYQVREQASKELVSRGRMVVPMLTQAAKSSDPEVAHRAEECLKLIEKKIEAPTLMAAARLLAAAHPPDAAAAMLDYLPFAENASVATQIEDALPAVAARDGKPEEILVKALDDPLPLKRGAAAQALCRAGLVRQVPALARLLHDPDTTVRLRIALALADAGNRDAIPVVIDFLGELSGPEVEPVMDLLMRLADGQGPETPLGATPETRRKCRDAWAAWWTVQGPRIDLTRLEWYPRLLGFTLVVLLNENLVTELDANQKQRWRIEGLAAPLDAQVLPGERVLIAEFDKRRVTERSFKGEVLWEKVLAESPIGVQRSPEGNTFIVTHEYLLEVDRTGKEVFRYTPKGGSIVSACKARDGRVGWILEGGRYQQLDSMGKDIREFPVSPTVQTTGALEMLPDGGILVAEYGNKKVVELDAAGKEVWSVEADSPTSVVRLPKGHILVSSQANMLIEFDRAGKAIWEQRVYGHPTRVRRR